MIRVADSVPITNAQFSDAANYSVIATDGAFMNELVTNVAIQDGGVGAKAGQAMEFRSTAGRRSTLETSTNLTDWSFWKNFSADAATLTLQPTGMYIIAQSWHLKFPASPNISAPALNFLISSPPFKITKTIDNYPRAHYRSPML